jgi:ribokinase
VPDVIVLGDANADLVLRGDVVPRFGQAEQLLDRADFTLGGSGAIVACGLARLGLEVAIVGAIGDDAMGELVTDVLFERGVSIEQLVVRPRIPTGISVILSGDDRAILTYPGAIATLSATDVDLDVIRGARHVHSASRYLLPLLAAELPRLLNTARDAGASVSVDTNDDPSREWAGLGELLAAADVALPNEGELLAWARALGPDASGWQAAASTVSASGPQVVAKLGSAGGAVVSASRGVIGQEATRLDAVDTTGAGDSFDAGWIAATLEGLDPAQALRWAVASGGLSTRGPGGTAYQGDRAEVLAAAAVLPPPERQDPTSNTP